MGLSQAARTAKQYQKFLAVLGKSGKDAVACKAAGLSFKQIAWAKANYADFQERYDRALVRAKEAEACRVPGRGPGQPRINLTPKQMDTFLVLYGEIGAVDTVLDLIFVTLHVFYQCRKRDPVFDRACEQAKLRAAAVVAISGTTWRERRSAFFSYMESDGLSIEAAAFHAGISYLAASLLISRENVRGQAAWKRVARKVRGVRPGNRFAPHPNAEVRAHNYVQGKAAEAVPPEHADAERAMTPEMRLVLDSVVDDGLTIEQAGKLHGRTEREIGLWCEANAYFRQCVAD